MLAELKRKASRIQKDEKVANYAAILSILTLLQQGYDIIDFGGGKK